MKCRWSGTYKLNIFYNSKNDTSILFSLRLCRMLDAPAKGSTTTTAEAKYIMQGPYTK
jgi:hypothetical protein